MVRARLLLNSMGATMSISANRPQMTMRPTFQGLNRWYDVVVDVVVVMVSVLPRAQQALRAEDQDQYQEQVRQDGGHLRNGEFEQWPAKGFLGYRHAQGLQSGGQRMVNGHGKGLHQADKIG